MKSGKRFITQSLIIIPIIKTYLWIFYYQLSRKTAMWVGVDSKPEFLDLLNSTFNWIYATKRKLEEKGQSPDVVDPKMRDLPQLAQLLAVKGYGGTTARGPTWSSVSVDLQYSLL